MSLPLDLRLALSPLQTYRALTQESDRGSWWRALERAALVALILGTAITISSARRVPIGLVLMGVLCWTFVVVIQSLIGAIVISSARRRPLSFPRSLELLFVAHLPWSLWALVVTGLATFTLVPMRNIAIIPSLLIPCVWTVVIIAAFCRTALGCDRRRAWQLTLAHQIMTWTAFVLYVTLVSGIWPRFLALIGQ